jgi:hypothetical protein
MKELMVAVERAVRPVRASGARKDRMREELLAHLTAQYEENMARLGDSPAALAEALRRFGGTEQLTRELQASLLPPERMAFALERWLGWRAPETAFRYNVRLALWLFLFIALVLVAAIAVQLAVGRSVDAIWMRVRLGGSLLLVLDLELFLLGLLYFKVRDALCSNRAAPPSRRQAVMLCALAAIVTLASGPSLSLLALGDLTLAADILRLWLPLALLVPLSLALFGVFFGPSQIRHVEWCCLDIGP